MSIFPIEPLKLAFKALPDKTDNSGELIDMKYFYVPPIHAKALHFDNILVEGIRGAGKSEWWLELQDPERLKLVANLSPRAELENTQCSAGFGQTRSESYPNKNVLTALLKEVDAQTIWNTIVAWVILGAENFGISNESLWIDKIKYFQANFEIIDKQLVKIDNELHQLNKRHLVLFDALDRTADDWKSLRNLLKGLLQVALEFRSFRAIRLKIFVRPDMLDPYVYSFPDGSKIVNNQFSLDWNKLELFNLLWQYIGNAQEGGDVFRDCCYKYFKQEWKKHPDFDVWIIPEEMRKDETVQRQIFHALAGEWMGTNAKSGYTYTWLPNHLGDTYGKVSPRSFLAALREAADNPVKDQELPLSYQSIKKGVQKASQIRVNELKEDYRWIETLITPLDGTSVPCSFESIVEIWEQQSVKDKLQNIDVEGVRLPPSRLEDGYSGIKQDLVDLGIFEVLRDGRINMPDVYRVGYGLGRKGGVKPVR